MKEFKFRTWEPMFGMHEPWNLKDMTTFKQNTSGSKIIEIEWMDGTVFMQYTGLKDKNGKEIYEGDILEFADKWEWYKGSYGIKMHFADPERLKELREQYDREPMERRVIEVPSDYEWLLSSEIQTYWHVIGNIYQNQDLLTPDRKPSTL